MYYIIVKKRGSIHIGLWIVQDRSDDNMNIMEAIKEEYKELSDENEDH